MIVAGWLGVIGIDRHIHGAFADRRARRCHRSRRPAVARSPSTTSGSWLSSMHRAGAGRQRRLTVMLDACRWMPSCAQKVAPNRKGRKLGDRRQRAAGVGVGRAARSWPAAAPAMAVARTVIPDATLNWPLPPLRAIMLPRPNRNGSVGPPELTPGSWSSPLVLLVRRMRTRNALAGG